MDKKIYSQSGRSMLEMLGVLAIMGLLSVGAVASYRYAYHKMRANQIIQDARMAHTMLVSNPSLLLNGDPPPDIHAFQDVPFNTASGKDIQYRMSDEMTPEIKVSDVTPAVCQKLLGFIASGQVKYYTTAYQELTSCAEQQDMILMLDIPDAVPPQDECQETADCNNNGYCQEGHCIACPDGQMPNEQGDGCTDFCNPNTHATCYDADNQSWCCLADLRCSAQFGSCLHENECAVTNDCPNGYCEESHCIACPDGQIPNEEGNGCIIWCNPENQRTCFDDDEHTWCCATDMRCGSTTGSCLGENECVINNDCRNNGYCDAGACVICEAGQRLNDQGTGCIADCDEATEQLCTDNQNRSWCCPSTLGCATEYGACPSEDGKCAWNYSQGPLTADCSYNFVETDAQATCSLTYSQDPQRATCSLTLNVDANNLGQLAISQACPQGQYCNVQFTDQDCNTTDHALQDNTSGLVWGICNPYGVTQTYCTRVTHVQHTQPCPAGRYCVLYYTNQACSTTGFTDDVTGTIYGVCSPLATNEGNCIKGVELTERQGCGAGRYCNLNYTDENCGTTLSDNAHDIMWGRCNTYVFSENTCERPITMRPTSHCPTGKYCFLNWTSDTACTTPGDSHSGPIYGTCVTLDKNTGTCPYNQ